MSFRAYAKGRGVDPFHSVALKAARLKQGVVTDDTGSMRLEAEREANRLGQLIDIARDEFGVDSSRLWQAPESTEPRTISLSWNTRPGLVFDIEGIQTASIELTLKGARIVANQIYTWLELEQPRGDG